MKTTLTAALLALTVACATAQGTKRIEASDALRKLQMAELVINTFYVDSVDENKLAEDGIRGMLEKLDPHSTYSTPKEVKAFNESIAGNFDGIGVQFNIIDDTLIVIQPVMDGPSEKVGIVAGDRIVLVNDTAIAGVKMSKEEIMRRLRGPKGTMVKLGVVRRGIKGALTFNVVRDRIPVNSVDAAYLIRPGVGYIRVGSFGATTHDEFMQCMAKLKEQGMKSLILDLQGNGGGLLSSAVSIANEFLAENDLIVYTEGRRAKRAEYRAQGNGSFPDGKLVVLVDEYTASAAEIVTGAVQDQDRGTVVGRRTFGKGLVQRPFDMPDGSMIKLTISHYYTPSGRCIQKPYEKGKAKDYNMDVLNRFKRGELESADSIHFADSLKCYTLRKHRTVYGGGGIMPDHFVPLDTTTYTKFHRELSAKGAIINANLRYIDSNRKQLRRQYKAFDKFRDEYKVPQSLIDALLAEGEKIGVKPKDEDELATSLPRIRLQLKALIARDLWEMGEYYAIANEENDVVKKAVELMNE